MIMLFWY